MGRKTLTYPLDRVRHSKESRPQKKSFLPLDGYALGLEVDWEHEELRYFLYKDKRRNTYSESDWVGFYAGEKALRKPLYDLVAKYYTEVGRAGLLDYTKMELNIPVGHLHYHIWAGTLQRVLQKEVIYN